MSDWGFVGRVAGALLLLGLALTSCGKTNEPGSGETHFLQHCEGSCGGGYQCLCGVCTKSCDGHAVCNEERASCRAAGCATEELVCDVSCTASTDCAGLGSDFECAAGVCRQAQSPPVCPPDCFPVSGYPLDDERSCFDLTRAEQVACQCGEPAVLSACRTRISDDSSWMLPDGSFADPSAWGPCTTDVSSSCDFASCEHRPNSVCSFEDTCASSGCDNFQFLPDGCVRAACEADADCLDEERCVSLSSIGHGFCSYSTDNICNCSGPTIDLSGAFCNPTSEVGPGGEWQELNVVRDSGMCVPDACRYEWHVTPDGEVQMRKLGVESSATLSAGDLLELDAVIDGPELRRDLQGRQCVIEDLDIDFELVLPSETQLQNVAGCVEQDPDTDVYARVWQILQRY
jgi:hypothetical protein